MDRGSSFSSKSIKELYNAEGIEIVYFPVNVHRATGCVERTKGSIKNFVLTHRKEKNQGKLENTVERALGALRFALKPSIKMLPFETQLGREAIQPKKRQFKI